MKELEKCTGILCVLAKLFQGTLRKIVPFFNIQYLSRFVVHSRSKLISLGFSRTHRTKLMPYVEEALVQLPSTKCIITRVLVFQRIARKRITLCYKNEIHKFECVIYQSILIAKSHNLLSIEDFAEYKCLFLLSNVFQTH